MITVETILIVVVLEFLLQYKQTQVKPKIVICALVVKLVDTTDLKSVPFWSASSSLAEGTIKNKYNPSILIYIYRY